MIVNREFRARCRACKQEFPVYNYKGLDKDSRMGNHWCEGLREFFATHPKAWKAYDKIREVPITPYARLT